MNDFFRRLSLIILPPLYVWLTKIWFSTFRVTVRNEHYMEEAQQQGAVIVPFWHYSIFYVFHHLKQYPGVALISASRDGEYIARLAELLHFETVRGSSNNQGMQALKKLLRAMRNGKNVGIVADGSQGPVRRLQPGSVFLSSKTGAPLLPIVWSANRYMTFGSWDQTVLPYPFAKIIMRYGKPINIPRRLDGDEIEQYRAEVELVMNELYCQVWSEFDSEQHDNGVGEVVGK